MQTVVTAHVCVLSLGTLISTLAGSTARRATRRSACTSASGTRHRVTVRAVGKRSFAPVPARACGTPVRSQSRGPS